jgi:hypothetical protein
MTQDLELVPTDRPPEGARKVADFRPSLMLG